MDMLWRRGEKKFPSNYLTKRKKEMKQKEYA